MKNVSFESSKDIFGMNVIATAAELAGVLTKLRKRSNARLRRIVA